MAQTERPGAVEVATCGIVDVRPRFHTAQQVAFHDAAALGVVGIGLHGHAVAGHRGNAASRVRLHHTGVRRLCFGHGIGLGRGDGTLGRWEWENNRLIVLNL